MKRNVLTVITAAIFAVLAAGCVSVPSGEFADEGETHMPVDRGTGSL